LAAAPGPESCVLCMQLPMACWHTLAGKQRAQTRPLGGLTVPNKPGPWMAPSPCPCPSPCCLPVTLTKASAEAYAVAVALPTAVDRA
jgi:hypothetical protein